MDIKNLPNAYVWHLLPLWARAKCTEAEESFFCDPKALEWKQKIEFAWSFFEENFQDSAQWLSWPILSWNFDSRINEFFKRHPRGKVVELACGFESTYYRHQDKNFSTWLLVDLPEVIELRKSLDEQGDDRFKSQALSLLDHNFDKKLLIEKSSEPILFLASRLLSYFNEAQVYRLVSKLQASFASHEFVFDVVSLADVEKYNKWQNELRLGDDAPLLWGLNRPKSLEKVYPAMKVVDCFSQYERVPRNPNWGRQLLSYMTLSDAFHQVRICHTKNSPFLTV